MAFDKNYDQLLKVLLTGDSSVGKTSLINKFCDKNVEKTHISTIGIDFKMKLLEVNGKKIKLQIWDTAGQERFETLSVQYYRRAQGILLMYDITSESSFKNVSKWIRNIKENAVETVKVLLIGNKVDLENERKISTERGKELADQNGCPFFETSAYTGHNVPEAFRKIAELILKESTQDKEGAKPDLQRGPSIVLTEEKKPDKKTCC